MYWVRNRFVRLSVKPWYRLPKKTIEALVVASQLIFGIHNMMIKFEWQFNNKQENAQNRVFSCVLRNSTPRFVSPSVRQSVHQSVRPSITLYFFFGFCVFWPHCSCPNDHMTSSTAPVHPHANGAGLLSPDSIGGFAHQSVQSISLSISSLD